MVSLITKCFAPIHNFSFLAKSLRILSSSKWLETNVFLLLFLQHTVRQIKRKRRNLSTVFVLPSKLFKLKRHHFLACGKYRNATGVDFTCNN